LFSHVAERQQESPPLMLLWLTQSRGSGARALKRHLLAGVGFVALLAAGPAGAADQAAPVLKAPPAAVWSWSGFYIGAHGGYGWGRDHFSDLNDPIFFGKFPNFVLTGVDSKGFLGGFQAGANWQSGAFVGGLEIDLSGTAIKGSQAATPPPDIRTFQISTGSSTQTDKFDLLGSGRARLGYLAWPNVLLYGTGGLAWTRFVQEMDISSTSTNTPPPGSASLTSLVSTPSWRFGWVAGVGGEARISDTNWLVRLEYLHYDFGDSGSSFSSNTGLPLVQSRTSSDLTVDVVRGGLSYKFDPLVAASAGATPAMMPIFKAPVHVAAPWSWSGFYLGAHGGYGWGHDPFTRTFFDGLLTLSGVDSRGFVGGFQAGANWQSGDIVGGLEIDLSGTGIKGSTTTSSALVGLVSTVTQTDKFDVLGSARARLGYLATPSVLVYGTGGLAWTRFVATVDTSQVGAGAFITSAATPSWEFGWVAGAGIETRLWDTNWLGRIEYLHYDFGDSGGTSEVDATGGVVTFTSSNPSGHLTTDLVRAALSYKLDWSAAGAGRTAMPVKAPTMAAWSWSGYYIGGYGGYGWGRDPFTEPFPLGVGPSVSLFGVDAKGFVGGFLAGANWQSGAFVGGLEIDLGTGPKGSASNVAASTLGVVTDTSAVTQTDKFDMLGSARARIGYVAWPSTLIYGTGGLAWTRLNETVDTLSTISGGGPTSTVAFSTSTPNWEFGWVAGAGAETRLWNTNWLARVEYLHYDFGDSFQGVSTFAVAPPPAVSVLSTTTGHLTADVIRGGLSYKLN
jgi:opacity protein-like surface antigen